MAIGHPQLCPDPALAAPRAPQKQVSIHSVPKLTEHQALDALSKAWQWHALQKHWRQCQSLSRQQHQVQSTSDARLMLE